MPKLRAMFVQLDTDGDGEITLKEFGKCDKATREHLCELFNTDNLVELFEILDNDGSGSVSIDEFCDEMTKLATTQFPMEQIRMLKNMSLLRANVFQLNGSVGEMEHGICEMALNLGKVDMRMSSMERKMG